MFGWWKTFLGKHVIEDVPAELARCEFGCGVEQCKHGDWQNCENRILDMEREAAYTEETADEDAIASNSEGPARAPDALSSRSKSRS